MLHPVSVACCCCPPPQVLGHTKTVLVLVISWLYLHETMTSRKMFGICLAVAGMVSYGYFTGQQQTKVVRSADDVVTSKTAGA